MGRQYLMEKMLNPRSTWYQKHYPSVPVKGDLWRSVPVAVRPCLLIMLEVFRNWFAVVVSMFVKIFKRRVYV